MTSPDTAHIKKWPFLALIVMLLVFPGPCPMVFSQTDQTARVLVLPFAVNAPENLGYLSTQIATVIGTHLEQDGARSIATDPGDPDLAVGSFFDLDQIGRKARAYEATHVIWGSFTMIGERFSLDARLFKRDAPSAPQTFHVEGRSLENLLSVLKTLSGQIGLKLFERDIISEIKVLGNERIEADAILRVVKSETGGIYQDAQLTRDLRAIYQMGYFDDLRVEADDGPGGKVITFHVKEKPVVRRIRIRGNLRFTDEEIRENMTLNTGAVLNIFRIRSNMDQIESMYKEKNYHKVRVDYKIIPLENNQADIEFTIDDGPKLYVTSILFEGNQAFDAEDLKDVIKTNEKGFFSFITSSGDMDRADLEQDTARLNAFYHNQGFIRARISDPDVQILEEEIHIIFKINEGPQFKVGKVDIQGDLIMEKQTLVDKLSITREAFYNREKVRNDLIALTDIYGDEGYAYADIRHRIDEDPDRKLVNITFDVDKRQQVFFEKIIISGNTRTRDKVIRRELRVHEQELFSGKAIKRSIRSLIRLDYFEDIKVNQMRGSDEDKLSLKLDVVEKPTGTFSFGAGYSSEENLFFMGSIAQRNFLGRGQTLRLTGQFGGSTNQFVLGFTEPWLLDTRLSATIEAYNQTKEYDDQYDLSSYGGGLRFSYPVLRDTRLFWSYSYVLNDIEITDFDNAPQSAIDLEGVNLTSAARIALVYDSRDRLFNPSEGSKHSASFEYAGLGGDIGFDKYELETGWYIPIYKGLVGFVHGRGGYVRRNSDDKTLPDYEKYYLGGINSLRGFDYRDVHLTEINENGEEIKVGGEYMIQFNAELIFPLYEKLSLMGLVFYDTGNVYEQGIDLGDLRETAGYGIRWISPIAPIRIEYGHILDQREGEGSGRWEFTMGGAF